MSWGICVFFLVPFVSVCFWSLCFYVFYTVCPCWGGGTLSSCGLCCLSVWMAPHNGFMQSYIPHFFSFHACARMWEGVSVYTCVYSVCLLKHFDFIWVATWVAFRWCMPPPGLDLPLPWRQGVIFPRVGATLIVIPCPRCWNGNFHKPKQMKKAWFYVLACTDLLLFCGKRMCRIKQHRVVSIFLFFTCRFYWLFWWLTLFGTGMVMYTLETVSQCFGKKW